MPNINDAFPSQYLKASDLKGRSVTVEIDRVEFEPVGQAKEMKPIVYFAGKEKGLVLNKTNSLKIASLADSAQTEDWAGVAILIYPTETSFQGEMVDCIRVKAAPSRHQAAAPPPPPPPAGDDIDEDSIPF